MPTPDVSWKNMSSVAGAALALLALAELVGTLGGLARRWSDFFCIPLRVAIETLPTICLAAWQLSVPYLPCQLRVLESFLQISASCWHLLLTLTRVA